MHEPPVPGASLAQQLAKSTLHGVHCQHRVDAASGTNMLSVLCNSGASLAMISQIVGTRAEAEVAEQNHNCSQFWAPLAVADVHAA